MNEDVPLIKDFWFSVAISFLDGNHWVQQKLELSWFSCIMMCFFWGQGLYTSWGGFRGGEAVVVLRKRQRVLIFRPPWTMGSQNHTGFWTSYGLDQLWFCWANCSVRNTRQELPSGHWEGGVVVSLESVVEEHSKIVIFFARFPHYVRHRLQPVINPGGGGQLLWSGRYVAKPFRSFSHGRHKALDCLNCELSRALGCLGGVQIGQRTFILCKGRVTFASHMKLAEKKWCRLRNVPAMILSSHLAPNYTPQAQKTFVLAAKLFPNHGENASNRAERQTSEASYNNGPSKCCVCVIYPETSTQLPMWWSGGTTELKHLPSWTALGPNFPYSIQKIVSFTPKNPKTQQQQTCEKSTNKNSPPAFFVCCRSHDDIDQREDKGLDWA